jgi:ribosomal protein S6--L-glutamate ligase
LEVNSSPGLEGIENATGVNVANSMIEAIEKNIKYRLEALAAEATSNEPT